MKVLKYIVRILVIAAFSYLMIFAANFVNERYIISSETTEEVKVEVEQHLGVDKLCFITTITPTCKDVNGVEFLDEACAIQIVKRLDNYPNLRIRWLHSLRGGNISIRMEDCKAPVVLKPGYI